jgi:hypothetical protein
LISGGAQPSTTALPDRNLMAMSDGESVNWPSSTACSQRRMAPDWVSPTRSLRSRIEIEAA